MNDLDIRARRAVTNLKSAVHAAELSSTSPAVVVKRSHPLAGVLRPAIVLGLLLVGAAVGVALVRDSTPPIIPVVPTTTAIVPTTLGGVVPIDPEPSTPTTVYTPPEASTTVATDVEAPIIEVTSPQDGAEFEVETVTFSGITEPGARVFAGRWEAEVEKSGEWHIVLILSEGANVARFTARDAAGNEAVAAITVHLVAEDKPVTTTTQKELAEFSAHATFGSCSETPPWDIYYGTGEPGSLVSITSKYGSGSVEVSQEGTWEKKVIFETAPEGEPFLVTVADDHGRSAKFEFVHETP